MSHPFNKRSPMPRLTQDAIDRGQVLGLLDILFEGCPMQKKLSRRILRAQHRLQEAISTDEWLLYLDIESATNERLNFLLSHAVRFAWNEGRRSVTRGG